MDKLLKSLTNKRTYTHNCPECGSATRCDLEIGRSVCWCFYEDTEREPDSFPSECLCKYCLKLKETTNESN